MTVTQRSVEAGDSHRGTPWVPEPTQHDAAYFDYVEGLKRFNYTRFVAEVMRRYEERASKLDPMPATMEEAGSLIEADPLYTYAGAVQRASQELAWRAAADSIEPHREELRERLRTFRATAGGTLELQGADFELPSWYTAVDDPERDIHLRPYWAEELVGAVYERGGGIYRTAWRTGYGKDPTALIEFAKTAPARSYQRILDLGCSFGGNTLAFRLAYPDAGAVVGIDLSADALRWAHVFAEQRGVPIEFSQRDACETGYPDESFDLVTGFLFLHELPNHVLDAAMAEAWRLLRPGGHLMFLDLPRFDVLPPEEAFVQSWDTRGNGERYWSSFLSRDFPALLRQIGFVDVHEGPLDFHDPGYWGSAALMRTGEAKAHNRWTTHADKPA